jgi:hypothetical protein
MTERETREAIDRMTKRLVDSGVNPRKAKKESRNAALRNERKSTKK